MASVADIPYRHAQRDATSTEHATPAPVSPILCLPPHLRRRIYLHTELLARYENQTHAVLSLNGGTPVPSSHKTLIRSNLKHGFHGLLLSCQTIYKEASALLYRHNRFIIRYWETKSLAALRRLTPYALSNLTFLKVVLNQASCHHKRPRVWHEDEMDTCHDSHNRNDEDGADRAFDPRLCNAPLEAHQPDAKILLAEWQSTVEYVSSHISPKSLELSLVCDVHHDDIEAARSAVRPFSLFPELRNCHIRLSRVPTSQLQQMAHDVVLEARRIISLQPSEDISGRAALTRPHKTSHSQLENESRLLALPRELRFHILKYTDLITPWKEVEWSRHRRDGGKYVALNYTCGITQGFACDPEIHHGCRFRSCWAASMSRRSDFSIGCFCQLRHSSCSTTCACWAPPTALFLVSSSWKPFIFSFTSFSVPAGSRR